MRSATGFAVPPLRARHEFSHDLLGAVIRLGPNLFYGTGLAACILVFRRKKAKDQKNKVLIVDASKEFKTGRARNELLPEHVERIHGWVRDYTDVEGIARLVTLDEIAANDHNLNIPSYVGPKVASEVLTVEEAMKRLRESAEAAFAAEQKLVLLLRKEAFLCLSERFFQHAVGTSAGSLSPPTNWSSLASFEFDLPPLDQQRRIAEILWAVDEALVEHERLCAMLRSVHDAKSNEPFEVLRFASKSVKRLASEGMIEMQKGPFGTVLAASSYRTNGVAVVNPVNMDGDTFDMSNGPFIDETDAARLSRYRINAGDIVLCRKRHVGRTVFADPEHDGFIVGSDCIRFRTDPHALNSKSSNLRAAAICEACPSSLYGGVAD